MAEPEAAAAAAVVVVLDADCGDAARLQRGSVLELSTAAGGGAEEKETAWLMPLQPRSSRPRPRGLDGARRSRSLSHAGSTDTLQGEMADAVRSAWRDYLGGGGESKAGGGRGVGDGESIDEDSSMHSVDADRLRRDSSVSTKHLTCARASPARALLTPPPRRPRPVGSTC